jgi:metallophosphoesterase superfamily enzyme
VSPVVIDFPSNFLELAPPTTTDLQGGHVRVMYITDPHFGYDKDPITQELKPYHDNRVLEIALSVFKNNSFDALIWGGDILDCNEWSNHFISMPEFRQTTQPALNEASRWLSAFRVAKTNTYQAISVGNHNDRLQKYLIENLSEAYLLAPGDKPDSEPLMSMSNLLGLRRKNIDYKEKIIIGDTKFIHGDISRKGGGSTARAHLENSLSNIVFGHVHRREIVTEVKAGRKDKRHEVFSLCPGCACYTDGRVPGSDSEQNWQNGIAILDFVDGVCVSHQIVKMTEVENGIMGYFDNKSYWAKN